MAWIYNVFNPNKQKKEYTMRKVSAKEKGFIIGYFLNLILSFEWLIVAIICYALHSWFDFSDMLWKISLLIFFVWPAIVTFIIGTLITGSNESVSKPKANKNPYSDKGTIYGGQESSNSSHSDNSGDSGD